MAAKLDWADLRGDLRKVLKRHAADDADLTALVAEVEGTVRARVERLAEQELEARQAELEQGLAALALERAEMTRHVEEKLREAGLQQEYEAAVGRSVLVAVQAMGHALAGGMYDAQTAMGAGGPAVGHQGG
jgi:hypothetical protein